MGTALREQGHQVRLIPAQSVKSYRKSNKNDRLFAAERKLVQDDNHTAPLPAPRALSESAYFFIATVNPSRMGRIVV